jgi:hypothetical protein
MGRTIFRIPNILKGSLLLLGGLGFGLAAHAADHRDSPRIAATTGQLGNLDILDLYAFQSPQNRNSTVLIMTMSTDAGVISPAFFNPFGIYEFKITNQVAAGNFASNLTYQIHFGQPDHLLRQSFAVTRVTQTGSRVIAQGATNRTINVAGQGKFRAGLFDDPFFFDLLAFNRFKARALAGDPGAAHEFLGRSGDTPNANIPNNFFGGFNCLAIVIEVPSASLQSSPKNTSIGVWARTIVPGAVFSAENPDQFDRKGRPGINTVLIPDGNKDIFNSASPLTDIRFRPAAKAELGFLFGTSDADREKMVNLLLPDVLTLKTNVKDGFDKLNGRQLADDVIDTELSLFTNGAVSGDSVSNDSVFLTGFPYLGTPNPKPPARP